MAVRELALALELDRRVAAAGATERISIPDGVVLLNPELAEIRTVNELVLDAPLTLGARELTALADRWLGHLPYRFVRVDDETAGERLADALSREGWDCGRTVLMTRPSPRPDEMPVPDPRARPIDSGEHEALMLAHFAEADYGADFFPELPRRLADVQMTMLAHTESRTFGAGEDGGLQSMCELYLDRDVEGVRMAMIEQVGTLTAYRERGLARAVVAAAMRAATAWGAELLMIPADHDDWPQVIYAGLGFVPAGVQLHCVLRSVGDRDGDPLS